MNLQSHASRPIYGGRLLWNGACKATSKTDSSIYRLSTQAASASSTERGSGKTGEQKGYHGTPPLSTQVWDSPLVELAGSCVGPPACPC